MEDTQAILELKASIFDIIVQQEAIQQQHSQLEQDKQAKLTELRAAIAALPPA